MKIFLGNCRPVFRRKKNLRKGIEIYLKTSLDIGRKGW
jgi:hypothetical protein